MSCVLQGELFENLHLLFAGILSCSPKWKSLYGSIVSYIGNIFIHLTQRYVFALILSMYSLLIIFWINLCSHKKRITFVWLGTKLRRIFITWSILIFALFTAWAIGDQFLEGNVPFIIFKNFFGVVAIISIAIATLWEGIKLQRELEAIPAGAQDTTLLRVSS